MRTYVLIISSSFPKTHKRAGEQTYFKEKIGTALMNHEKPHGLHEKLHTIRGNYELWEKRFEKIDRGEACLSIREWTGMPYRSKQIEFARLTKDDGIGIQSLHMTPLGWFVDGCDTDITTKDFAKNDGLTLIDFSHWFKGEISIDMEPMAIIHFTEFRY